MLDEEDDDALDDAFWRVGGVVMLSATERDTDEQKAPRHLYVERRNRFQTPMFSIGNAVRH